MSKSGYSINIAVAGLGGALVVFFVAAGVGLGFHTNIPTAFWAAGGAVSGGLLGLLAPPPGTAPNQAAIASDVARAVTHAAASGAASTTAASYAGAGQEVAAAASAAAQEVSSRAASTQDAAGQAASMGLSTTAAGAAAGAAFAASAHLQAADATAGDPAADDAAAARNAVLAAASQAAGSSTPTATSAGITAAAAAQVSRTPIEAFWGLVGLFGVLVLLSILLAWGAFGVSHGFTQGDADNVIKAIVALTSAAGTGVIGLLASPPQGSGQAGAG